MSFQRGDPCHLQHSGLSMRMSMSLSMMLWRRAFVRSASEGYHGRRLAKDLQHKSARLFEKKSFSFPACRPSHVAARRQVLSWETFTSLCCIAGLGHSRNEHPLCLSIRMPQHARACCHSFLRHSTTAPERPLAAISMSWRRRRPNVTTVSNGVILEVGLVSGSEPDSGVTATR